MGRLLKDAKICVLTLLQRLMYMSIAKAVPCAVCELVLLVVSWLFTDQLCFII